LSRLRGPVSLLEESFTSLLSGSTRYRHDSENPMITLPSRPTGVTILVILEVLGGILGLGGGLFLLGLAEVMIFRPRVEVLLLVVGLIFTIMGAIQLFLAHGLWNGKGWAWTWTLVFAAVGVVLAFVSLLQGHLWGIVRLVADVLLICYLNASKVKGFFGKAAAP